MTQCEALDSAQQHDVYSIYLTEQRIFAHANLSGNLRRELKKKQTQLVTGDRVCLTLDEQTGQERIQALLPRSPLISRVEAGTRGLVQPMVANADTLLICTSLNEDLNPRRLERYLAMTEGAGVAPVLALTKADLCQSQLDKGSCIRRASW